MIELFSLLFLGGHLEDITSSASLDTSASASTVKEGPWKNMYRKDKYARDRVMKSARLLLPHVKDTDTILDVGCFTWEARKYFPRSINYIGIDQKAYHAKTKVIDFNHGFEPIPCQAVLCLETLEHLVDPTDCLHSIEASLQTNGHLVISLPNEATLFHRVRCFLGVVDQGAFQSEGKHLHLPSLKQSKSFLESVFDILDTKYYISPSACGSQQAWVGRMIQILPDGFHQFLADRFPSLFARGFIFLCRKKGASPAVSDGPLSSSSYRPTPERPQPIKLN